MKYDVAIIGAGPGGIFSAYELTKLAPSLRVAVFEAGHSLEKRHCPKQKTRMCMNCKPNCHITTGFSGAGAGFSGSSVCRSSCACWDSEVSMSSRGSFAHRAAAEFSRLAACMAATRASWSCCFFFCTSSACRSCSV